MPPPPRYSGDTGMGGRAGAPDALLEPCEGSVPSTLGARGWKRSRSAFACCDREQAAVYLEGSGDPGEDGQRARPFWSLSSPGPVRAPAGRSLSAQRQLPAWARTRRLSPRATARGLPSASTPASCGLRPLSLQAPPTSRGGTPHHPPRAGLRSHAQGPCRRAAAQGLGVLSAALPRTRVPLRTQGPG